MNAAFRAGQRISEIHFANEARLQRRRKLWFEASP
jgi:hypothetical protein